MKPGAVVLGAAALLSAGGALAQDIGPGNPDVVMECFMNDKPSANCNFACGTELASPPGGKEVGWGYVDRVEIYHKGNVGRADTRSWVFVRFKPGPQSPSAVAGLYIGPRYFCLADISTTGGTGVKFELRITKFNFN